VDVRNSIASPRRVAVIAGAGPAGLTAAYELLMHTDVQPIVIEMDNCVGGISRTVNYKGNRIDIGGHRFFSKNDRVMQWWLKLMPLAEGSDRSFEIAYQNQRREVSSSAGEESGDMLVRKRISRIYFRRNLLDYPLKLNSHLIKVLGLQESFAIGGSYLWALLRPRRPETTLEDFLVNRFGFRLFRTFFQSYTEKVWGKKCDQIDASWGRQRIKGLSIFKTLKHAISKALFGGRDSITQKRTETSLIERFLYPRLGPGQLWEKCLDVVQERGGEVRMRCKVEQVRLRDGTIHRVCVRDLETNEISEIDCDYFVSSMPIVDLISACDTATDEVRAVSKQLEYRAFITVGLLIDQKNGLAPIANLPDNWIYIQESDVHVGRIQVFGNWSPEMVADRSHCWIGLEFFCDEGDEFWARSDESLAELAKHEIAKLDFAIGEAVIDSTVVRMPKAYPSYTGGYAQFEVIKTFLDSVHNLFPVGRNGMHRYNNQDHSMLASMEVVDMIACGQIDKSKLWLVNAEEEYHEEKESNSANR
jgi:protoporphyrinogen oxidase